MPDNQVDGFCQCLVAGSNGNDVVAVVGYAARNRTGFQAEIFDEGYRRFFRGLTVNNY